MFLQTGSLSTLNCALGIPLLPSISSRKLRRNGTKYHCEIACKCKQKSSTSRFAVLAFSEDNAGNSDLKRKDSSLFARNKQTSKDSGSQEDTLSTRRGSSDRDRITLSFTTTVQEDPFVQKLRAQLGSLHTVAFPTFHYSRVASFFGVFFLFSFLFDKLWTLRKTKKQQVVEAQRGIRPQVPTSLSLFLEKDLQRKESVEWVNMVLEKLWKVYRPGLENWLVGLLQPIIDNLKKPLYVERVEVKQFSLGAEPMSVRSVERRTSRRDNDLQYNIGLRYTGGARMLLMLTLKFGILPVMIPVGVRDFDVDGEVWVKLQLIPSAPWVGTATWAFVSLPKIKLDLAPFRFFNLMAIPVLSMFLTKLLTEDLPRLFVRPNKIVLNFEKGQATGPVSMEFKMGEGQERNKDFVGELSVVLVDARKLDYIILGKSDPYVVLSLGDQVVRSKKNSQTTVTSIPGAPIWNQDFHLLVADPQRQKLNVRVRDSLGIGTYTVGTGELELGSLQDTVPGDRIVTLNGGWGLFGKKVTGEVLLRLTYKAYVEDEEEEKLSSSIDGNFSSDEENLSTYDNNDADMPVPSDKINSIEEEESFMDNFVALLTSEEFQGIVASAPDTIKNPEDATTTQLPSSEEAAQSTTLETTNPEQDQQGNFIFWFALITGVAVLVAISLDGSNFFNP